MMGTSYSRHTRVPSSAFVKFMSRVRMVQRTDYATKFMELDALSYDERQDACERIADAIVVMQLVLDDLKET